MPQTQYFANRALTGYLYKPGRWKGGLQWIQYWGGGDNNLMTDRDFLSGNISYSF